MHLPESVEAPIHSFGYELLVFVYLFWIGWQLYPKHHYML